MIIEIDNLLDEKDCEYIESVLVARNDKDVFYNEYNWDWCRNLFPWTFVYDLRLGGKHGLKSSEDDLTSYHFEHNFFYEYAHEKLKDLIEFKSPFISILDVLLSTIENLDFINFNRWFRIKSNLYLGRGKFTSQNEHIDFYFPHYNALYMINTCDGGIKINNKFYEHVKNKLIIFDGKLYHIPIHPIHSDYKLNILMNFFADIN